MFSSGLMSRRIRERRGYRHAYSGYSTQEDEEKLQSFEKKIPGKIYEPVWDNDLESFQRITNENILWQLCNKSSVRRFLIEKRLEWAGHV